MLAAIDGIDDLTLTTNASLLAETGTRAGRRRAAPGHGQPRRARRRDLHAHERRRLPGGARARRNRCGRGCRARPGQGQRGHPPRHQRARHRSTSPSTSGAAAPPSASSSTWTSATRTAGAWTMSFPPPRWWPPSTRAGRSSRSRPHIAARSRSAIGTATAPARSASISSVTQPFCGDCTRARLSADGQLYTCLFATAGHDLRALVRSERDRCRPRRRAPSNLDRPFGSLLGAADSRDGRPAEGRDELHRRVTERAEHRPLARYMR